MQKLLLFFVLLISTYSCAQEKQPLLGDTDHQREQNAKFKDASKSPLTAVDRKSFKTLDFYKYDADFVVNATLTRTPNEKPFKMKTSTSRQPLYVKYGILTFTIKGEEHTLSIYQNVEAAKQKGEEDSLFLPFIDNTSGDGSYGGGRYIDTKLPEDTMIIDFNTAYNPYCAYSERYSCPIPPRENYIDVRVEAGVKAYKKH